MRKRSEAGTTETKAAADPFAGGTPPAATETRVPVGAVNGAGPEPAAAPFEFESAHKAQEEKLPKEMERLVERTFVDDPVAVYDRLERELKIGEKRSDHGTLQEHLDNAEWNARDAFKLWRTAQLVVKQWEHDNTVVLSAMKREASRALETEKKDGLRSKQITDADIETMTAAMYPDEYRAQQTRRLKVHALERSCEDLNNQWVSRCRTLAAMASRQR